MTASRREGPRAFGLASSDDGRLLIGLDRDVVAIDVACGKRLWRCHPLSHPASAAVSPDGTLVAVKSTSGRIVVLDARSGEVRHDHRNEAEGPGSNVCFSPDGACLVDGSWAGTLTVRDALGGTIRRCDRFSGEMVSGVSTDRTRRRWLVEHLPVARADDAPPPAGHLSVRIWPFARTWPLARIRPFARVGTHRVPLPPEAGDVTSATLSPDGEHVALIDATGERQLCIARIVDGGLVARAGPIADGGTGSALAWSTDGRHIGSVQDKGFAFYRSADLSELSRLPCPYPSSLLFLPGGERIALGSWSSSAVLDLAEVLAGKHRLA